ncbi:response regulator receiver modulated CheB methylesterase [Novosphingobium sp. Rr 2-17]|uniref:chemotaxis-specific protein-glutamate methyltransferase CheB n=1 Tax=Novosphingobium sp. Rr 2-17 TaxID=555793 RepID=UPI00026984B4|nr:chemotaxis-specific protein-glutamate methyltransferase CheB [Novosphingobium sp. Rr 2-17]EIZ81283.1 response regulator receiver modulated CheB methylesterase [Novosphingobium sp. Rr 2-17]
MIKLLVVDDSPLMRRLLVDIFTEAGGFDVAVARNGAEALALLAEVAPDVITLDIHMPGMDGLDCLDRIMVARPCPVVMVSALTAEGADETLEAIELGAVDFIAKPRGALSLEIDAVVPALVEKVRAAAGARISRTTRLRDRVRARAAGAAEPTPSAPRRIDPVVALLPPEGLVLVGCSTGGPPALDALLGNLPANFPWPILVAQHMPASFTGPLAQRLDRLCALAVSEVTGTTVLASGNIYIGRGDADLVVTRRAGALAAAAAPSSADHFWHPSVDRLVTSAMKIVAPERLVGVLMTGMGNDGASAMTKLKALGGTTLAESADSAVIWGMPGALVAAGGASTVAPLDRLAAELLARFTR